MKFDMFENSFLHPKTWKNSFLIIESRNLRSIFIKKKGGVEIGRVEKVIVFILFGALGFLWSASLTRESRVHIEGI